MSGIGRFGAILSAFAGAQMLALGWSFVQVFAALLVPAGLGALAVLLQGWHVKTGRSTDVLHSSRG